MTAPLEPQGLRLSGEVPSFAAPGRRVNCEWELRNESAEDLIASFYLHSPNLPVDAVVCATGRVRSGRFYASAKVPVPAGTVATVSARVTSRMPGDHSIRVVVCTSVGMTCRTDVLSVAGRKAANTPHLRLLGNSVRLVQPMATARGEGSPPPGRGVLSRRPGGSHA